MSIKLAYIILADGEFDQVCETEKSRDRAMKWLEDRNMRASYVQCRWENQDVIIASLSEDTPKRRGSMRMSDELAVISRQLDKITFTGVDQNPDGIRDTLFSQVEKARDLEKKLHVAEAVMNPAQLREAEEIAAVAKRLDVDPAQLRATIAHETGMGGKEAIDLLTVAQQKFNGYAMEVFLLGATVSRLNKMQNAWGDLEATAKKVNTAMKETTK